MRYRVLTVFVAALLAFTLPAGTGVHPAIAAPPGAYVEAGPDEYFYPSTVPVPQGGTVHWDFTGIQSHTVTDATGMVPALYDSGIVPPDGPNFLYRFHTAGTYAVVCTLHVSMTGLVKVPIRAAPPHGPRGRTFTVTWSTADARPDFVFDVQKQRKGNSWKTFETGTTIRQGVFQPERKGTYRFRARLHQLSSDVASGWSDPDAIVVR